MLILKVNITPIIARREIPNEKKVKSAMHIIKNANIGLILEERKAIAKLNPTYA